MPEIYSRNLAAAEYDEENKTLSISFKSGRSYEYYGVPESVYGQLIQSIDPGAFFNAYIRTQYQQEETE